MKETNFVKQNKEKWRQSEQFIKGNEKDPQKLSSLFVQVVDDLSYSQTYYKHRSVRVYLNTIAREFFSIIYDNKKEKRNRFKDFWLEELPQVVIFCKHELIISFIVFSVALAIGVFSSANDKDFTVSILGDDYVKMTLENIKKGDPMAVYKEMNQIEMFLHITMNNLMVAMRTYVFGLFMSIGTLVVLLYNGIMVGSFQFFFAEHNLLAESAMTIWIHGTIEISSIIIAGGAGLTLGSGMLFPGTYSRLQAFQMSAMRSLKLMFGIAPFIVMAGIIESFLTRYTEVPSVVKILFIVLSAAIMIGYFIIYPWRKSLSGFAVPMREVKLQPNIAQPINFLKIKNNAEILGDAFGFYKRNAKTFFTCITLLSLAATTGYFFIHEEVTQRIQFDFARDFMSQLFFALSLSTPFGKVVIMIVTTTIIICLTLHTLLKEEGKKLNGKNHVMGGIKCLLVIAPVFFALHLAGSWAYWIFALIFGMLLILIFGLLKRDSGSTITTLITSGFMSIVGLQFILFFTVIVFLLILTAPLTYLYIETITWNFVKNDTWVNDLVFFIETFLKFYAFNLLLPLIVACTGILYYSLIEITSATALKQSIANITLKHLKRNV